MRTYAGIDLHSSNCYLAVIDEQQRRLFSKRLPNSLDHILAALQPFKDQLAGVVVESTYNWYWLVDGLQEAGYRVHLANPSAIRQYEGLKHTDDQSDAFWLAQQLLLGILPQGYIYPKAERPTRDLLRRRSLFVRHRTAHILSLQSMVQRCCGHGISANEIKKLTLPEASALFSDPQLGLTARFQVETIGFLSQQIRSIEKAVLPQVKLRPEFEILLTIPGIGQISGADDHAGGGRYPALCQGRQLCLLLPMRQEPEAFRYQEEREKATARTAIAICPGPMSRRPTLRFAIRPERNPFINASALKPRMWSRSKPWPTSWHALRSTSCATSVLLTKNDFMEDKRFGCRREPA